jgi:hypothetical protein
MAISIKRSITWNTFSEQAALGSHCVANNKALKVTRVHVAGLGDTTDVVFSDRSGTFDRFVSSPGTTATLEDQTMLGHINKPVYDNVLGTFSIRAGGSVAAGTYTISWEGIEA